jgi:hypothetical protein
MKVFKDVVGLFCGASGKGNGVGMEAGVGNEMKDSFSFENLGETTKLSNGIGGNGCKSFCVHSNKVL